MIPTVPDRSQPLVDNAGMVTRVWQLFFNALLPSLNLPMAVSPIGASPFAYTAQNSGTVVITGGTLTTVTLTRGTVVVNMTNARVVPVSERDIVTITYSVVPTSIQFIPN